MNFWEKSQKIDRRILYAILIVFVSLGLFVTIEIPTDPDPSSKDFYTALMTVPEDKTIIVQTDWTNSTRGESMGHFENLLRILMNRKLKFVFYSAADPVAPQVARTVLARINQERKIDNLPVYEIGKDYIDLGYFANAEATNSSMATDLRSTWKGKRTKMPEGGDIDVFQSPVLKNVKRIEDCGMMIVVTASASIDIAVQRLNKKVKMSALVTGVVGPSVLPFYQSKQVLGVGVGLKGVYDTEYMMKYGINQPDPSGGKPKVVSTGEAVPPILEGKTFARGSQYYGTLHIALLILILAVVFGNVSMFMSKKRKGSAN